MVLSLTLSMPKPPWSGLQPVSMTPLHGLFHYNKFNSHGCTHSHQQHSFGWSSSFFFMKSFITDTHRTSVQGYLCFFSSKVDYPCILCVCVCVCVCVCARRGECGIPMSHCVPIWVLTTLLTPCDDWRAFCPIERTHSDPLLPLRFCFAVGFCRIWKIVSD